MPEKKKTYSLRENRRIHLIKPDSVTSLEERFIFITLHLTIVTLKRTLESCPNLIKNTTKEQIPSALQGARLREAASAGKPSYVKQLRLWRVNRLRSVTLRRDLRSGESFLICSFNVKIGQWIEKDSEV